jgi:hypothetical protein
LAAGWKSGCCGGVAIVMRKTFIHFLPLVFFIGCATNHFIETPAFVPQKDEGVIVTMQNGTPVAFINNPDFDINIRQLKAFDESGVIELIIMIRNNMQDSIIISRYDDFQLSYYKDGQQITYPNSFAFDEYANKVESYLHAQYPFADRQRSRNQIREGTYSGYFKENDIKANGGESVGVLSFPYDDYDQFQIAIRIKIENFVLRRDGEYNIKQYIVNFRKNLGNN